MAETVAPPARPAGVRRPTWQAARRAAVRVLVPPLAIYAASRVIQLALIAWMRPNGAGTVFSRLLVWDGGWFIHVAEKGYEHGYTVNGSGVLVGNGLAFFPGYPLLIRAAHAALGLDFPTAALFITWTAGAAAAVLVHILGTRLAGSSAEGSASSVLYNARTGLAFTALLCAQPMSVALSLAYSEALFVAFVAGMFVAAHSRWWLTAGALGLAAALTRPTGLAAAVGLAVAAALALRDPGTRKWRPILAATVALAGVPAYLIWVGLRVGSPRAWFDIQTAGWGSTFDYGLSSFRFVSDSLRAGDGWIQVSVAWLLIAAVVAAAVAVARRVWVPLVVYGLIALVLVIGQGGYYHSKPRLLVPVLLILVPAAAALGRARPRTAALVLTGYAAFGLWYGAYLVTVWPFAI